MNKLLRKLARFVGSPYLQTVVALVLIVSSLQEGWDTLAEVRHGRISVSHGTLLLGISHLLRTLPDLVEGIERASERIEADT
jgi:hypothetical protein